MTESSESERPTPPVEEYRAHASVKAAPRGGVIGLFGPVGIWYLLAALFVAVGLFMAIGWSATPAIPDYYAGPNNYSRGFSMKCGTLLSPGHLVVAGDGAEMRASSYPDAGPPPGDWTKPLTAAQICGSARRPVYIAEVVVGLAALAALLVARTISRRTRKRREPDVMSPSGPAGGDSAHQAAPADGSYD